MNLFVYVAIVAAGVLAYALHALAQKGNAWFADMVWDTARKHGLEAYAETTIRCRRGGGRRWRPYDVAMSIAMGIAALLIERSDPAYVEEAMARMWPIFERSCLDTLRWHEERAREGGSS